MPLPALSGGSPPAPAGVYDVALDARRHIAYLACYNAGVALVDMSDPYRCNGQNPYGLLDEDRNGRDDRLLGFLPTAPGSRAALVVDSETGLVYVGGQGSGSGLRIAGAQEPRMEFLLEDPGHPGQYQVPGYLSAFDGDRPRLGVWLPGGAGGSLSATLQLYNRKGLEEARQVVGQDAQGHDLLAPVSTVYRQVALLRQSDKKTDPAYNFYLQRNETPNDGVTLGMLYDPQSPDPALMVTQQGGTLRAIANPPQWNNHNVAWGRTLRLGKTVSRPWVEWGSNKPVAPPATLARTEQTPDPQQGIPPYADPLNLTYFLVGTTREVSLTVYVQDPSLAGKALQVSLDPADAGSLAGDASCTIPQNLPAGGVVPLTLRITGNRPTPANAEDNLVVSIRGGKEFARFAITISRVNLTVDSNNDGNITDADDAIELNADKPGKLIALNQNDDNLNDRPDWKDDGHSSGQTFSQDDPDLQAMKLALAPAEGKGRVVLQVVEGGGSVKLWTSRRKVAGSELNLGWGHKFIWNLPSDTVPDTLFIEGKSPGSVKLRLSYFNGGDEISRNEVKAGVVIVTFAEIRPASGNAPGPQDTQYGYDDAGDTNRTYPAPKASEPQSQKWHWVSIAKGTSTFVNIMVEPQQYSRHVLCQAHGSITCSPSKLLPNLSKQVLDLKGVQVSTGNDANIVARLGGSAGAEACKINVLVDSLGSAASHLANVTAHGESLDGLLTAQALQKGANQYLRRAICELVILDTCNFSIVWDQAGDPSDYLSGYLNLDERRSDLGPQWQRVKQALGLPQTDLYIIHVSKLRNYKPGRGWAELGGIRLDTDRCIIISDAVDLDGKYRTTSHETPHFLYARDVSPASYNQSNIMHWQYDEKMEFYGYYKVEACGAGGVGFPSPAYTQQWLDMVRPQ